ncbi:hypothetical protein HZC09_00925 [Candidatus Micrarchaeota archaeon]|nr:hypothetical protein [Candidatus Micrarchaeota archaeon]
MLKEYQTVREVFGDHLFFSEKRAQSKALWRPENACAFSGKSWSVQKKTILRANQNTAVSQRKTLEKVFRGCLKC